MRELVFCKEDGKHISDPRKRNIYLLAGKIKEFLLGSLKKGSDRSKYPFSQIVSLK